LLDKGSILKDEWVLSNERLDGSSLHLVRTVLHAEIVQKSLDGVEIADSPKFEVFCKAAVCRRLIHISIIA
jgi:hypothetical protein